MDKNQWNGQESMEWTRINGGDKSIIDHIIKMIVHKERSSHGSDHKLISGKV